MREPERERWPLWPRVEVLPMPLPIPRPTRLRFAVAPLGALNVDRLVGTWISLYAAFAFVPRKLLGFPVCGHRESPGL